MAKFQKFVEGNLRKMILFVCTVQYCIPVGTAHAVVPQQLVGSVSLLPAEYSNHSKSGSLGRDRRSHYRTPEMEFLDTILTKGPSLLLHAIHSPFFWRILNKAKKTILFSAFKNPGKKSAKQENWSIFMNSFLQNRKIRVENQTKTRG